MIWSESLQRQGSHCCLPILPSEKLGQRIMTVVDERLSTPGERRDMFLSNCSPSKYVCGFYRRICGRLAEARPKHFSKA